MRSSVPALAAAAALLSPAAAVTIAEINGNRFLSALKDQNVTNVTGLVTAIASSGIYLRSLEPDDDPATSEGLSVFSSSIGKQVKKGDVISLNGRIQEYRSNKDYIYLTELTSPSGVTVVSSGHEVKPLVIGVDTLPPPTKEFSSLDKGGIFGVPNAVATVSDSNPELDPTAYGLDFWESLVGELVTVRDAFLVSRPNQYGDVWVRGNWTVTGINGHGGVTMLQGDANPETITIGTPLDGSKNPTDSKMGDYVGDVTGIVYNAFGTYRVLPLTKLAVANSASADFPAASVKSSGSCRGVTIADYNAENLGPDSKHMPLVVSQIVHKLGSPDLVLIQEVQDNSGPTNDGTVSANLTLSTLARGIEDEAGVLYDFVDVDPVNNKDGGQPGGNIRCAYLYRTDRVALYKPNPGGSLDANEVIDGPAIKYNPGLIDPTNSAFDDSRKPLVAMWKSVKGTGKPFFTINVHFTSKGGSTSLHGDPRPPINKGVEKRTSQTEITANFISQILDKDPRARIITAGDFNDFAQVQPLQVFSSKSGLVEVDDAAGIAPTERYTYLFDMNSQALDHLYVSKGAAKGAVVEHLHLNTWQNYDGQTSDHDPSVVKLNLCGC